MSQYQTKVLAVFNQKGGVGKTTLTGIIAEYLAIRKNKRVLIVDLDMQCNSSDFWVGMEAAPYANGAQLPPIHPDFDGDPFFEERSSIADIFYDKGVLSHSVTIPKKNNMDQGCIEILAGHPDKLEAVCTAFEEATGNTPNRIVNRLKDFFHLDDVCNAYDVVILDTGPSRSPVFRAALRAATHGVIPFEPEEKSTQGINAMLQAIESENLNRQDFERLDIIGLCPNKVRLNTNLHRDQIKTLRSKVGDLLFPEDTYLPVSVAFPERDVKNIEPKYMMHINQKHKAYLASSRVGEYVFQHLFNAVPSRDTGTTLPDIRAQ